MGSLRPNAEIIYESPDGGETVYGRYRGETERFLVGESLKALERRTGIVEDKLWRDIRNAAKTNPTLQQALDRAIIIYHLTKEDHGSET
jgi:hypothetical protein